MNTTKEKEKEGLLTINDIAKRLAVSTRTIWRLMERDHKFPKPIRFSKQIIRWSAAEFNQYTESLKLVAS